MSLTNYSMNASKMFNTTPASGNPTTLPPDGFTPRGIILACLLIVVILFAIGGNLVVCFSFTLFRNFRSMTNYFLVSLSISDIMVALFVLPVFMLHTLYKPRPFFTPKTKTLLRIWTTLDMFFSITSIFTLTAIAVERNLAITQPFYYTKLISPFRVHFTIAFIWILSLVISLVVCFYPTVDRTHLVVVLVVMTYFIPLIVIVVMYMRIWRVARRQARRLRREGALATDLKAIKTIAIVIGAFFVCYTPHMISLLWLHFVWKPLPTPLTIIIIKWLVYLNSCMNPIIYTCSNNNYRHGFNKLFQTIATKLNDLRTHSSNKKARKRTRSRISLNMTVRTSVGSLLDGSKLAVPSCNQSHASIESRGSISSASPNHQDAVDNKAKQDAYAQHCEIEVNVTTDNTVHTQQSGF